jgi:hypothetical protein
MRSRTRPGWSPFELSDGAQPAVFIDEPARNAAGTDRIAS